MQIKHGKTSLSKEDFRWFEEFQNAHYRQIAILKKQINSFEANYEDQFTKRLSLQAQVSRLESENSYLRAELRVYKPTPHVKYVSN